MLRLLFWLLVLGAAGFVLNGNLPIPGIAQEEVVYTATPVITTCGAQGGCVALYALEVGNVGRSAQASVRVRLRSDAVAAPVIAPTVRRATGAAVAAATSEHPGVDDIALGPLEPEEHVALVFAVRAPARDAVLGWDRILVGVDPSAGSARAGEVGALTAGRVVHALGRTVQRLVRAAQAS